MNVGLVKVVAISNRVTTVLASLVVHISKDASGNLFKTILNPFNQEVKTQIASQEIEILMAKKLFEKLHKHGIKKDAQPHPNLCYFLCIDRKYKKFLMLKKLKRCIIDFNSSAYFQSIGLKKLKMEVQPATNSARRLTVAANAVQAAAAVPTYQNNAAAKQNDANDYEYYDEEDDDEGQEAGVVPTTGPPRLDGQ